MFVLEDLWMGKVDPSARHFHQNSEYHKLLKELCDLGEQITAELTPEGKKKFLHHGDVQNLIIGIGEQDAFIDGFRLGARLLLDVIGEYHSDIYSAHRAG